MVRGLAIGVAVALVAVACTSDGDSPAVGVSGDGSSHSIVATTRLLDDGNGFALNFTAQDRPEAVIVAEAERGVTAIHQAPDAASTLVAELANPTEAGGPLVFQLVDPDPDLEAPWLEVLLPVRPNGSTGWVRRADVSLSQNPYRVEIDRQNHRLAVFKANRSWVNTTVAIGTGDTPTPVGRFYITELLQPPEPGGPYGSYAFGLSGFSETLTDYAGGAGVIGIHGTNEPASLGTDVSHGCVRMANDVIESLAGVLPLGTPVLIS